jgi:hypothetical protein
MTDSVEKGIIVSETMLESGFAVLCRSGIADEYLEADKQLLVQIFFTMLQAFHAR